jgi:hypothetical protein
MPRLRCQLARARPKISVQVARRLPGITKVLVMIPKRAPTTNNINELWFRGNRLLSEFCLVQALRRFWVPVLQSSSLRQIGHTSLNQELMTGPCAM